MPRILWFGVLVAVIGFVVPRRVDAQSPPRRPAEFRVVVVVKGPASLGQRQFSRSLRRTLADEIGGLRSSRAFQRAQKELGIAPKKETYPSRLARAGQAVNADFVVFVRVAENDKAEHPRDAIVARGYLISVDTGKVAERERVMYAALANARQAGRTMATRMTEHLRSRPVPTLPLPEPAAALQNERADAAGATVASAQRAPVSEPPRTTDQPPAPLWAQPDDGGTDDRQAPPQTLPPLPDRLCTAPPAGPAGVDEETSAAAIGLRLGVSVGSGLYRDYGLSTDAGDSVLSYDLPPVLLVGLDADYEVPGIGLRLGLKNKFRPIGFDITRGQETLDPGGVLVDGRFTVDYPFALTDAFVLRPQLGLRWALTRVADVPDGLVLSSTALAPILGAQAIWGRQEGLQGLAGIDVGYAVLFDETPAQTGESPGGLMLGVDLGGRYWLDPMWAVSIDGRFTFDRIGFSGAPTRTVVNTEAADFRDASLSVIDAMIQVGAILAL